MDYVIHGNLEIGMEPVQPLGVSLENHAWNRSSSFLSFSAPLALSYLVGLNLEELQFSNGCLRHLAFGHSKNPQKPCVRSKKSFKIVEEKQMCPDLLMIVNRRLLKPASPQRICSVFPICKFLICHPTPASKKSAQGYASLVFLILPSRF